MELASFAWKHTLSIVSALVQINETGTNGSHVAAGFAQRFGEAKFILEVGMMALILEHAKNFMPKVEQ